MAGKLPVWSTRPQPITEDMVQNNHRALMNADSIGFSETAARLFWLIASNQDHRQVCQSSRPLALILLEL
jgi:hypothetical protein